MCSSTHQKIGLRSKGIANHPKRFEIREKNLQRKILKVKKCPPLFMSNKLRIDNHKKLYK